MKRGDEVTFSEDGSMKIEAKAGDTLKVKAGGFVESIGKGFVIGAAGGVIESATKGYTEARRFEASLVQKGLIFGLGIGWGVACTLLALRLGGAL